MILTMVYSAEGMKITDFDYPEHVKWIKNALKDNEYPEYTMSYSTSIIFTAVQLEIAKGNINHKNIRFCYNGQIIPINEYGMTEHWTRGFCEAETKLCEQLILTSIKKRKHAKES